MTLHRLRLFTALVCAALHGAVSPHVSANEKPVCADTGDSAQVAAIRGQRDAFNAAIRTLDIDAIEAVLAEDVLLITGTNSDVYRGREAQLEIWRGDADDVNRTVYVRTPACVQVSPVFPVAMEHGTWRGQQPAPSDNFASGSYSAKWRLIGGAWTLEVETYMTEACGGSFCPNEGAAQ